MPANFLQSLSSCTADAPHVGSLVDRQGEHQRQMRYYFNLVRAHEAISDQVGIELADSRADVLEATILEALAELRKEDSELANQWRGWMLEVRDVSNRVVLMIDLNALETLLLLAIALGAPDLLSIH